MQTLYSNTPAGTFGGVSVDNVRRTFGIGNDLYALRPDMHVFFAYLSRFAKKGIAETVWKPLESREQYQRRYFAVVPNSASAQWDGTASNYNADIGSITGVKIAVNYDNTGRLVSLSNQMAAANFTKAPIFILKYQVLRLTLSDGKQYNFKVTSDPVINTNDVEVTLTPVSTIPAGLNLDPYDDTAHAYKGLGQVIGTQVPEVGYTPEGWADDYSAVEFYAQRFHTAIPLISDSARATEYRGDKDELRRLYIKHMMSHKMDISNALLFGEGKFVNRDERYTWGVLPFFLQFGKQYSFSYANSGYDAFLDMMSDFTSVEDAGPRSERLVLASRKIMTWLSKLSGGPLANSGGTFNVDVQNIKGKLGHKITRVETTHGNLNFVEEPLLRHAHENYALMIDMNSVTYRPVEGNGISLDTYVRTNIQSRSETGRKDDIITEAGLEILHPERHGVLIFNA